MSNENKTALTAEEQAYRDHINKAFIYDNPDQIRRHDFFSGCAFASLQTKDMDKEIELKEIQIEFGISSRRRLESTIESQQKDIEELKAQRIVDAECISQSGAYRIESIKQIASLESQLSEVTKERDELREGMQKIATYRSESISSQIARSLLTPTK